MRINPEENSIVVGDCLEWLKYIPSKSIDMCYIDPPFFSNKNYEIIWGNGYERRCYADRWKGGIKSYIVWMEERVKEIYRVLKDTGTIFLHCDWHASHRLRVMLDEVFGEKNFVNEIIWHYKTSGGKPKRNLIKNHDVIFHYSKSKEFYWSHPKEAWPEKTLKKWQKDENGRIYRVQNKFKKRYYIDPNGKLCDDVWEMTFSSRSKERLGYPTQKPEELLERIIKCSTDNSDIVLDCFGGGGTTSTVAAKLKRSFITGDVSPVAARVMAKRLNSLDAPPPYKIIDEPRTREDWLREDGVEFEKIVCDFMGWEWSGKGVNDGGIDGWANRKTIPIQVKNHRNKVGRPDIQKFVGAMGKHDKGIFVAWDFATNAWDYQVEAREEYGKEIQFIKVEDILGDILIDSDKKMEIESLYREKTG